jgi:hypothetical protein
MNPLSKLALLSPVELAALAVVLIGALLAADPFEFAPAVVATGVIETGLAPVVAAVAVITGLFATESFLTVVIICFGRSSATKFELDIVLVMTIGLLSLLPGLIDLIVVNCGCGLVLV